MHPLSVLLFAVGVAILFGLARALQATLGLVPGTWAFHGTHALLALAVAIVIESVRRWRQHTRTTLRLRGNPMLRFFLTNLLIWIVLCTVVVAAGLPVVKETTRSLVVYLSVLYLAASALVGAFRTITTED